MSFVIMTGSWCLVASVLVNAYSCNLISYLTVPKYKPIVQSLEDVAANPDMQFAVDAGTVLADRTLVCDEIKCFNYVFLMKQQFIPRE